MTASASLQGPLARIIVVTGRGRPNWSTRRLIEALRDRGHRVAVTPIDSMSLQVSRSDIRLLIGGSVVEADALLVRGMGTSINAEQLVARLGVLAGVEAAGVPVVNPWLSLLLARSKPLSTTILAAQGLRVPETLISESMAALLRFAESKGRVVVKPVMGSLGLGSFLAEGVDQLYHYAGLLLSLSKPVYAQEYIEKRFNSDIRVFVVEGRVVAATRRIAPPGSWRTNIARGGQAEPVKLEGEAEELALRAVEALGLYYAGVDIAEDQEGTPYILEVNASPNWRGLFRATGVDPAGEIARLVEHLAKGR